MNLQAVYRLYPQPVFAVHEGAKINYPSELYQANFQPDDRSLAQRNIGGIIVIGGEERYTYPISPAQTTRATDEQ